MCRWVINVRTLTAKTWRNLPCHRGGESVWWLTRYHDSRANKTTSAVVVVLPQITTSTMQDVSREWNKYCITDKVCFSIAKEYCHYTQVAIRQRLMAIISHWAQLFSTAMSILPSMLSCKDTDFVIYLIDRKTLSITLIQLADSEPNRQILTSSKFLWGGIESRLSRALIWHPRLIGKVRLRRAICRKADSLRDEVSIFHRNDVSQDKIALAVKIYFLADMVLKYLAH